MDMRELRQFIVLLSLSSFRWIFEVPFSLFILVAASLSYSVAKKNEVFYDHPRRRLEWIGFGLSTIFCSQSNNMLYTYCAEHGL